MVEALKDKLQLYIEAERHPHSVAIILIGIVTHIRTSKYTITAVRRIYYPECVSDPEPIIVRDMKDYCCTYIVEDVEAVLTHQVYLSPCIRDYVRTYKRRVEK